MNRLTTDGIPVKIKENQKVNSNGILYGVSVMNLIFLNYIQSLKRWFKATVWPSLNSLSVTLSFNQSDFDYTYIHFLRNGIKSVKREKRIFVLLFGAIFSIQKRWESPLSMSLYYCRKVVKLCFNGVSLIVILLIVSFTPTL